MLFRPEVPFESRAEVLRHLARLVREAGPVARPTEGIDYCGDPAGRDIVATPGEVEAAVCGDCKKLAVHAAARALQAGRRVDLVMSTTGRPEEHVWIRVDGQNIDPSVESGMPAPHPDTYRGGVVVPVMNSEHLFGREHTAGGGVPFDALLRASVVLAQRYPWINREHITRARLALAIAQEGKSSLSAAPYVEQWRQAFDYRSTVSTAALYDQHVRLGERAWSTIESARSGDQSAISVIESVQAAPPWGQRPDTRPTGHEWGHLYLALAVEAADSHVRPEPRQVRPTAGQRQEPRQVRPAAGQRQEPRQVRPAAGQRQEPRQVRQELPRIRPPAPRPYAPRPYAPRPYAPRPYASPVQEDWEEMFGEEIPVAGEDEGNDLERIILGTAIGTVLGGELLDELNGGDEEEVDPGEWEDDDGWDRRPAGLNA